MPVGRRRREHHDLFAPGRSQQLGIEDLTPGGPLRAAHQGQFARERRGRRAEEPERHEHDARDRNEGEQRVDDLLSRIRDRPPGH